MAEPLSRPLVHLVGAGPGAADLLTVRAHRLLEGADLVLHDALIAPDVLAIAKRARLLNVGKRAGRASTDQTVINRLLVRAARRYACVVRLKGGDPMMFGRADEEIAACAKAGVAVEITPGVSAGFAAASALGVSLTRRGVARAVAFVTPAVGRGETADARWASAAAAADTAVVYMGGLEAAAVAAALEAAGVPKDQPAVLVVSASLPGMRLVPGRLGDLAAMAESAGSGPKLFVIGAVFEAVAAAACAAGLRAA